MIVTPLAVACAFTAPPNLRVDASIPVNAVPLPTKLVAVTIPEATTVSNTECPTTSNSDLVVSNFKFAVSSTAPEPPAMRTRPSVKSDTISDAADKSVPLNSKFPPVGAHGKYFIGNISLANNIGEGVKNIHT